MKSTIAAMSSIVCLGSLAAGTARAELLISCMAGSSEDTYSVDISTEGDVLYGAVTHDGASVLTTEVDYSQEDEQVVFRGGQGFELDVESGILTNGAGNVGGYFIMNGFSSYAGAACWNMAGE